MSTAQKAIMFSGDSITFGYYDFAGMGFRAKVLMALPEFVASGNNHDLIIGPQSTASAVPNPFLGDNRSWNQGTNGITISGLNAVIAARIGSASVTPTHHVVHVGINDVNAPSTSAAMLTDLGTLLDTIHATQPTAKILVMKIINELFGGGTTAAVVTAYNAGIPAVVAARSSYCNYGTMPTLAAQHFGDLQQIHPNSWGFSIMADAVVAGIQAAGW